METENFSLKVSLKFADDEDTEEGEEEEVSEEDSHREGKFGEVHHKVESVGKGTDVEQKNRCEGKINGDSQSSDIDHHVDDQRQEPKLVNGFKNEKPEPPIELPKRNQASPSAKLATISLTASTPNGGQVLLHRSQLQTNHPQPYPKPAIRTSTISTSRTAIHHGPLPSSESDCGNQSKSEILSSKRQILPPPPPPPRLVNTDNLEAKTEEISKQCADSRDVGEEEDREGCHHHINGTRQTANNQTELSGSTKEKVNTSSESEREEQESMKMEEDEDQEQRNKDQQIACMYKGSGCLKRFTTRQDLNQHQQNCVYRPVKCPLNCDQLASKSIGTSNSTAFPLTIKSLASHMSNSCPRRPVNCSHCSEEVEFSSREGHETKCPRRPVKCSYCQEGLLQEDLQAHLDMVCKARTTACSLSPIGCQFEGPKFEMQEHENCWSSHSELMIKFLLQLQTLNCTKEAITQLSEQRQQLEAQSQSRLADVIRIVSEINTDQQLLKKQLSECQEQVSTIKDENTKLKAQIEHLDRVRRAEGTSFRTLLEVQRMELEDIKSKLFLSSSMTSLKLDCSGSNQIKSVSALTPNQDQISTSDSSSRNQSPTPAAGTSPSSSSYQNHNHQHIPTQPTTFTIQSFAPNPISWGMGSTRGLYAISEEESKKP